MHHAKTLAIASTLAAGVVLLQACATSHTHHDDNAQHHGERAAYPTVAATNADDVEPVDVGQMAPDVTVQDADGKAVHLRELAAKQPMVVVFYRGGWCPFCTRHLEALVEVEPRLRQMGYQLVAISPDSPANLQKTATDKGIQYTLLSDSSSAASRAFGLAFVVDDLTLDKYRGYGIDLQAASGQGHNELPVPAVFVVQRDGRVAFRHYDPNYRTRLSAQAILEAAGKAKR
jgi:peroxiredoxin